MSVIRDDRWGGREKEDALGAADELLAEREAELRVVLAAFEAALAEEVREVRRGERLRLRGKKVVHDGRVLRRLQRVEVYVFPCTSTSQ